MANQWLRLWHDMPNDPKWRTIARISGQPIALVQAVFLHLLVDASRNVTRGHISVTPEDLASALDVTDDAITSVLDAMQGRVMDGNELSGWASRQPKREDSGDEESGAKSAAQRKREQRERERAGKSNGGSGSRHDESRDVTLDKDKEEDKEEKEIAAAATTPPRAHVHTPVREAAPDAPPSPIDGQRPETRYVVLIRQWEKARGKMLKVQGGDPRLTVWAEKGVTEAHLREAYELAVADRDKAQDPSPINTGFLDIFLVKVLNPRGGESALNRPGATSTAKPWQASWSGIEAKAEELGIKQVEGEHPQVFKARVFAAAGMTDEERARLRSDFGVTV